MNLIRLADALFDTELEVLAQQRAVHVLLVRLNRRVAVVRRGLFARPRHHLCLARRLVAAVVHRSPKKQVSWDGFENRPTSCHFYHTCPEGGGRGTRAEGTGAASGRTGEKGVRTLYSKKGPDTFFLAYDVAIQAEKRFSFLKRDDPVLARYDLFVRYRFD